ncbi:MAG: FtsH protease activity modulator HflK [Candidatus Anammoximicrobium sp.]|nr:FtsH protease activity modulator HflK [Candidatus Anammoximicrobium sp.]
MTRIPSEMPDPPAGLPQLVAGTLLLVLIGYAVMTSFYTVSAESQAVVLRFGKMIKTVDPGLHWKLPLGIDRHYPVQVRRQLKQEFGFGSAGASNPWQATGPDEQEAERNIVTGDLNAALVEWVVQYRIDDPEQYLFAVRNPDATLRHLSESVMREMVGDRTVDEVITIGRQEIEAQAVVKLQEVTQSYGMGLKIDQVQLKNVNPPQKVQASFNEVNQAQQEKESAINVATGEYNKVVPRAEGEADQKISAAQGYAVKRTNEAEGDVAAFEALLAEYVKAPEVTRRRIYLETMSEILPKVGKTVILDEDARNLLPLLNLGDAKPPIQTGGPR